MVSQDTQAILDALEAIRRTIAEGNSYHKAILNNQGTIHGEIIDKRRRIEIELHKIEEKAK